MDTEKERDQLRQLQKKFETAVLKNEISQMKDDIHKDFSYVSFMDRHFTDFESFSKRWSQTHREMIGSGKFEVSLNPEPTFFYDDIAVAHGNSDNLLIDKKGREFNFTSNWTVVFKKSPDGWKVIRAHNSTNPFSNPMLLRVVKVRLVLTGLIALALGLGIGLLI